VTEQRSTESAALAGQIAEIPQQVLSIIRNGFAIAAALPEDKQQLAIQLILRQMEKAGGTVDTDMVVKATGLSRSDASRVNAALSTTIGLLTESSASTGDFVVVGRGVIFDERHAAAAEAVASQIVNQRAELRRSLAHENLANRVLPSLTGFDVAVDLRFKFRDHQVEDSVAVAVVHVATDSRSQRIWLQLSRHDVQRIIEKLSDTLKQMDVVEAIVTQPHRGLPG
jgi:hypothetical protein